ncbi:MAG: hypothetical protein ABIM42_05850 [candidate division WOR-3 bacterium]
MNQIDIPKCSFTEYYGSGTSIKKMIYYLNILRNEEKFPFQKMRRKTSDFDYARNMKQLGLIYQQNDIYYLTPRGESMLIIDHLVDSKHGWKSQLIKFCVLKALADLDWPCVTSIVWYVKIQNLNKERLKEIFCPLLSEKNFKDHWLRLHIRLAEETDLVQHYIKLYGLSLSQSDDERTAHNMASSGINPYSETFIGIKYFDVQTRLLDTDAKLFVQKNLAQILKLYSAFSKIKEIGNIEPVKSLLLAIALREGCFISEPTLSRAMLSVFLEKEIPLYRTLWDLQFTGRGIFKETENVIDFYPDFNLRIALQKIA